jgi:hypothetical protein
MTYKPGGGGESGRISRASFAGAHPSERESYRPTFDDAKRYCPCNSKCRGDDQCPICGDDFEEGQCKLDNDRCHPESCSTLKMLLKGGSAP